MKDYDLEIHYHPSKENLVADALSHKAHCNYLPTVSIFGEESSIRVSPIMAQYNVTLTSVLRGGSLQLRASIQESHTLRGG
jgi:hypothetical protein